MQRRSTSRLLLLPLKDQPACLDFLYECFAKASSETIFHQNKAGVCAWDFAKYYPADFVEKLQKLLSKAAAEE